MRRILIKLPIGGGEPQQLDYDIIVVTAGALTRTFPIQGVAEHAIGLKHVDRLRPAPLTARASAHLREGTVIGRRLVALRAELRRRRVPLHWSNLFGVVALTCTIILFLTGILLMFVYVPSSERVTYAGSYGPLHGTEVSKAFDSVMTLSFETPGGLLLRQLHHWSALLLPAALILQLLVTFFTGAFRRPRRGSWLLLFLLFVGALAGGWSGYALPDDMLSSSGLRIVQGIVLGIPVVGTWISVFLFGGEFPGSIIENLYPIHVLLIPAVLVGLLGARAWLAYRHKPPQFAAPGRDENTIVGIPLLPNAASLAAGLMALVSGVLILMSATVTITPTWAYGPADPSNASAGSQPDWYTGFLDGALRLVPPGWEVEWLGHTWTLAVLVPLGVIGTFLLLVALYPFLESWISRDSTEHHILDRPRNAATRTGIGVAGMVFYGVLWAAASADVAAAAFHLSFETIILTLQFTLVLGPPAAFGITRRVCLAMQRKDREIALHGYETGRLVRLPGGEYLEIHQPVDAYQRWRLVAHTHPTALAARPDETGRLTLLERGRARLATWFFEDRVEPAPATELDDARTEEPVGSLAQPPQSGQPHGERGTISDHPHR
jgi:ubiquinol-cytochrome c reductase cytochrome b subunit